MRRHERVRGDHGSADVQMRGCAGDVEAEIDLIGLMGLIGPMDEAENGSRRQYAARRMRMGVFELSVCRGR